MPCGGRLCIEAMGSHWGHQGETQYVQGSDLESVWRMEKKVRLKAGAAVTVGEKVG